MGREKFAQIVKWIGALAGLAFVGLSVPSNAEVSFGGFGLFSMAPFEVPSERTFRSSVLMISPVSNDLRHGLTYRDFQRWYMRRLGFSVAEVISLYGLPSARDMSRETNHLHLSENTMIPGIHRTGSNERWGALAENFLRALATYEDSRLQRIFINVIGHGLEDGSIQLAEGGRLTPDQLQQAMASTGKKVVGLYSSCYSGHFVKVGGCGFAASDTQNLAWEGSYFSLPSADSVPHSYIVSFKQAIARRNSGADYNNDGRVSFSEAHFFAAMDTPSLKNRIYSTLDHLIEEKSEYETESSWASADFLQSAIQLHSEGYARPEELVAMLHYANTASLQRLSESDRDLYLVYWTMIKRIYKRMHFRKVLAHPAGFAPRRLIREYRRVERCERQSVLRFLRH